MIVLKTYLRRMAARPWMIALTMAVPVLMVLTVSGGGGGNGMRVALIDRDDSLLSQMVRDAVEPVALFVEVEYEQIGAALVDGRIEYALVLPSGMQEAVIGGGRARVETYSLHGVQMTRMIRSAADAVLSAAHNVALRTDGDTERFERALVRVRDGRFQLEMETFRSDRGALATDQAGSVSQLIGFLTLTMLLSGLGTSLLFLKDVEDGTFHRTIAGPISLRRYMVETNAAFFGVAALQAIAAVLALRIAVPQLSPNALLMVSAILATFALVAVSATLAVANTMKTVRRTAITANFLIMPVVMLGGAFWPFDIMPDYLQRIGAFSPTRWTMTATSAVLSGASLADIAAQLGVLVLFAIVFGLLGSWRRVDVAK
ncbi:MAG: ABC transporter permease [Spirochaetaceae bacterium]|nr:MAG: ABC transporter permease [Spirochaetaceae bacterium]